MNFDLTEGDKALLDSLDDVLSDTSIDGIIDLERAEPDEIAIGVRPWIRRLGDAGYFTAPQGAGLLVAQKALAAETQAYLIGVRADECLDRERARAVPPIV